MQLLVNHQLIPFSTRPKNVSLAQAQTCYKRYEAIAVNWLYCLFSMSKNKDQKRIYQSATNVMLALKFLLTS